MYINYNINASLIALGVKMSKNTEQNKVLFYKSHNKRQLLQIIGFKSLKVLDLNNSYLK